jgi:hypothetical protein
MRLLLFIYVTEEAGGTYVLDMPWVLAAKCNMITNKQTNMTCSSQDFKSTVGCNVMSTLDLTKLICS